MSEEKTEWTSIDSSANKEVEEKIEIEIEGQEKEVDAAAPIKREEGIASELPEKKESISGNISGSATPSSDIHSSFFKPFPIVTTCINHHPLHV